VRILPILLKPMRRTYLIRSDGVLITALPEKAELEKKK